MSVNRIPHYLGRAALAGILGLSASAAMAGGKSELVVSEPSTDLRSVEVQVSDLDLSTAYDRGTLAIRIEGAAREVCDVNAGSKIDRLPDATACLTQARAGAADQLEARGYSARLALAEYDARNGIVKE
ncbi:UrcA family protein [Altererythrobacter atlanticus]|uniref:Uncharacterized protein n=1 Tax=Croceibacterium atlanticum TaxID=1267766 RepID=A0A0F7KXW1_9SPHN|nr:UrcA family protein [Croceibacterium atlanticum]AKH44057.1 hypothetical protein WYH_03037 [Croceibacterium atlanticum]MBB5732365.1 UrcA family protein [Croceibacterium atlanticum]